MISRTVVNDTIEMYKNISFYFQDESVLNPTQINFQDNISNQFCKLFNDFKNHINVLSYKDAYLKVI